MAINYDRGLVPVNAGGAIADSFQTTVYQASTGGAIFTGTPVGLNAAGKLIAVGSVGAGTFLGAATGFFYIGENGPVEAAYISNVSSKPGIYNGVDFRYFAGAGVKVTDDPDQVYTIEAFGSISIGLLNTGHDVNTNTGGNSITGNSNVLIRTATEDASAGILTIIGVLEMEDYTTRSSAGTPGYNYWDTPSTVVLVKPRNHRDFQRSK